MNSYWIWVSATINSPTVQEWTDPSSAAEAEAVEQFVPWHKITSVMSWKCCLDRCSVCCSMSWKVQCFCKMLGRVRLDWRPLFPPCLPGSASHCISHLACVPLGESEAEGTERWAQRSDPQPQSLWGQKSLCNTDQGSVARHWDRQRLQRPGKITCSSKNTYMALLALGSGRSKKKSLVP